ncbi:MAG: hypothetical protein FWD61_20695, partial [Phycisphaerales bacterium]|nr:hypothetical protein [Phycisphaerales bacterium]
PPPPPPRGGGGGGGGDIARIELLAADLPRAIELRDPITTAIKSAGYKFVTLDLLPFKSGSLHQLTKKNKRFKE